jgi:polyisoprenoid-binding protein YceI
MKSIILLIATIAVATAADFQIDSQKSWLKLDCKATGHDWTSQVKTFDAKISGDATTLAPTAVNIAWKFSDIDSDKSDRDQKMLSWLNATTNPTGTWKMTKQWKDSTGQQYVSGPLMIAGVSKEITIPVKTTMAQNAMTIDGDCWIDTTDFGLPVIRMVVLTVNPKVNIRFHLEGAVR